MNPGDELRPVRNFIGGRWLDASAATFADVRNPSTGRLIARAPLCGAAEVDAAVEAAHAAFLTWRRVPASTRVQPLFQLAALLRERLEPLSRLICEEMGKSLPDARAEMKRAVENCEAACGMPILQQGDKLMEAAAGVDGEVIRLPRGVYGLLAPFNFPGMVPFWFLPYALASGNTFVLKPSERVPLTMQYIAGLIERTDLPAGAFNMVQGSAEAAQALMRHPLTAGVSVVGSTRTARLVAAECAARNKRFQAMGGAKNHLVVMPDAPLDHVVRNLVTSCYGCAGQRCMAASAIVAVGDRTYEEVRERFTAASREVIVADPLDPAVADEPMVMGPVISAASRDFIHRMIQTGVDEGATLALDGRPLRVKDREDGFWVGPTLLTDVRPGSTAHLTEIFGPVVVLLKAGGLDEAIGLINAHPYGNGASIYTQNGHWARRFKLETDCGMIGVNVGIPAPVAHLPFGGMKDSQFSQIKAQGRHVIDFYTEARVVTERFWPDET